MYIYLIDIIDFMRDVYPDSQCTPRHYLVEMEAEMEVFVVAENKKIIFDGYAYTVHHNLVSSIRWKCSNKISKKCPGILVTSNGKLKKFKKIIFYIFNKTRLNI